MHKQNLLAAAKYLQKLAAGEEMGSAEAQHEAAESPQMEAAEHGDLAQLEQMIAQLSPEEQQELLQHIMGEQSAEAEGETGGEGDDAALASAIEQHLAQNPEASAEGLPPEKAASLNFIKSAGYIEGFLKQASDRGFSVEQAVNLYDGALTNTIRELHKESSSFAHGEAVATAAKSLKGRLAGVKDKIKEYANKGLDKAVEFGGKAKEYVKDKPVRSAAVGAGLAGAGAAYALSGKDKEEESEKTAAYYEGVLERAREYGFSDAEALQIVKSALMN
jgi:ElaB/YqjD/DUF883 family membrane-anchored ribosome-binding protein